MQLKYYGNRPSKLGEIRDSNNHPLQSSKLEIKNISYLGFQFPTLYLVPGTLYHLFSSMLYQVQSTKYVILVIGCFLLLHSTIGVWRSTFSMPYFVARISYFYFLKTLLLSKSLAIHVIFYPLGSIVNVLAEEEVELPYMVLHMSEVVEKDFEKGVIHGFGFIDPPLGCELLVQT